MAWGINSVALKPAWSGSPSLEVLLEDREHMVSLDRFYRDGGQGAPATPTEFRIGYSSESILAVFRCTERNPSFPAVPRTADEWYQLINSTNYPDTLFPDQVDLLIQPDMCSPSYYQFAMTPDGKKLGCSRLAGPGWTPGTPTCAERLDSFDGLVARSAREWSVRLEIPWTVVGGKPASHFGVLPIRTRWRDGEVSSPVAFDFMDEVNSTMKSGLVESPALDLFIETHFTEPAVQFEQGDLCRLPSGVMRWQRPAVLTYPDLETRRQIWQMQSSLETPTDEANLPQRIELTQRWTDLMLMEGFTSLPRSWNPRNENLAAYIIRRRVNGALRRKELTRACQLLDAYLSKLDAVSRWWYADGSPGDVLQDQWIAVSRVDGFEVERSALRMRCTAGDHSLILSLVLPETGGVRIFGEAEGYWRPEHVLPLKVAKSPDGCSVESSSGTIVVRRSPFSISFRDTAGRVIIEIGPGSLAFRFGPDGTILAVDFRNRLDPDEVIYGFGEKYDCFNQVGNVLTLWGIDDWVGNGIGMRNTTYKPLPIFHSSRGYMVFSNSSYRLRADIGKTDPSEYRLTHHGPILDLYLWVGDPEKSLESYTALAGRPPVPPRWALEPWMGRGGDAWANGPLHDAVQEEKNTIARFAELDIPHSAIYAEGPSANSAELHEFASVHGIRVLSYFMPALSQSRQQSLMPELKPEELPVLHCASAEQTGELGYVDFCNPNAMELCRREWKRGWDLGVAGSMVDYGDMVPDDAVCHDGTRGDEAHNFYSYAYHRTMSEVWRERRWDDFILFGRAAAPGTQRWLGQFAGDHPSNFPGMRAVVTGALNLCACGFSTWGSDIGGYFGLPEPAVFARWTQLGCFSPLMRPHGKTPRDPWYFGEAVVECYKFYAWVRENLLDYLYAAAVVAHHRGIPIMRAMPLAFPGEPSVAAVGDQYMFGKDLLVAPVMSEDEYRTVSFPSGVWTDLWEGERVCGPVDLNVRAPLSRIPVYLRQSAVVPVQLSRGLRLGESMSGGRVRALVLTPPGGDESVITPNACNEAGRVTVRSRDNGSAWKLENLPETSHMLVYGMGAAAAVRVDGYVLTRTTECQSGGVSRGCYAQDGNRLVIHLPPVESRRPTRTIEVDHCREAV